MKHLCCSRFFLIFLLFISTAFTLEAKKSAIVYYGEDISYSNVGIHDYIIIEPEHISSYTHGFKSYKKKMYAYVSIGEASEYREYFSRIKPEWIIAENRLWKSKVMDISNDEYHEFFYSNVIQPLVDKGHENFFFDTLDSYQIATEDENERQKYELGLIRFIKKFKLRFPQSKLIINRGFEVMDEIHKSVDAVLFESLFYGLSSKDLSYTEVKKEDRNWLLKHIKKIQEYGLDLIAVDYMEINDKNKIRDNVKNIEALGLIPYISNRDLTRYGAASKTVVKREVLILHNILNEHGYVYTHNLLSLPIEYLGYIPITKRVDEGLPDREELSRYKAVIIWSPLEIKDKSAYEDLLKTLIQEKIKVLLLNDFALFDDSSIYKLLNIQKIKNRADVLDRQTISFKDEMIGFESEVKLNFGTALYQPLEAKELLVIMNSASQKTVPVAKTSWGGYVLSEMLITYHGDDALWIIDPFSLFKTTLELESIPVPDPSTQNGRRLLFVHIDGDAAMNRVEWDTREYSIGMMYEKILKKYTIPQSVSIVEAELSPEGLYPKDSDALVSSAKKIYQLEHVEAATHTFSHPFYWGKIKDDDLDEKYRLKVKDYDFSLDREIKGSLEYINSELLPQSKKPANTVFWTGDCLPTEEVLEYTYKHNYLNINGGDTYITNDKPWLSLVAPYALKRGEYYQVFVGTQNENLYTDHFLGPFWGYKKAIQTFKRTNYPRRLKPINIYYHFYSASKTASLNALDEVYRWALSQDIMPIYISEYIPKVMEYYDISISKDDNRWQIRGMKALKTLRLDKSMLQPDIKNSQGVIGQRLSEENNYVHLNTDIKDIDLELKAKPEKDINYLIDTNGEFISAQDGETSFSIRSYVDIDLNYHLKEGCRLESRPKAKQTEYKNSNVHMHFKTKEADFVIRCEK